MVYPNLLGLIMDQMRSCVICHCLFDETIVLPLGVLHEDIQNSIKSDGIVCHSDSYICRSDLSKYTTLLRNGCTEEECQMFCSPAEIQTLCAFSDRCSDLLAASVGSWSFLILFCSFLVFWIVLNTYFFITKPIDPYPFIFLNLILSVVAAIQAPIILMSQNRQAACDRARATYDYAVDLKAEMEIRKLHDKVDIILKSYPPKTP